MLAYVFWHRPKQGVGAENYESTQREFHALLETPSACFRLAGLPFDTGPGAYEDWYLVEDWRGIGRLSEAAVDAVHNASHNRVAAMANEGWGAVYALVRGAAGIPDGVEWLDKPRDKPSDEFVDSLSHDSIWRRQLVLGPAPEFCCSTAKSSSRCRI